MRFRWLDLSLVLLALVTGAAVYLAIASVAPTQLSSDSLQQDGVAGGAAPQDGQQTSTEGAESTQRPDEETAGEPSPSPEERLVAALTGQGDEPVDVVVLGDDTSNLRSEWVQLWGEALSDERPVSVVQWDETVDISYTRPDVLSEDGGGTPLTIWSASRTGADIDSVSRRLAVFLAPEPNVVVISLGVNDSQEQVIEHAHELVEAVRELSGDVPLAIVRQGAGGADSEVDDALTSLARAEGIVVLDARDAETAQEWADQIVEQTTS